MLQPFLIAFRNITDEDIRPYRHEYKEARDKVRKNATILNENLDETSKKVESSPTTDAEAIELMEIVSKDKDTTITCVEQGMSFIEAGERDKLLLLRELQGLDKKLKTIKGSLKIAIAKPVDLKDRIEHEEIKIK